MAFSSIVLRSERHQPVAGGGSTSVVHVAWLHEPEEIDLPLVENSVAVAASVSAGIRIVEWGLLGAPSARLTLLDAGAATLAAAASHIQKLFPSCTMMSFDAAEGFDWEGACAAALAAMGLRAGIPDPQAGAGSDPKRI